MKLRQNLVTGLLVLLVAAILVLFSILRISSEPESAVVLGLSASRLAIFFSCLLVTIIVLWALITVWRFGPKTENVLNILAGFSLIDSYRYILYLIVSIGLLVFVSLLLLGELLPNIPNAPEFLAPLYARLKAAILFMISLFLTGLWFIYQLYIYGVRRNFQKKSARFSFLELTGLTLLFFFLVWLLILFLRVWVLLLTRRAFASLAPFFFWQNLENNKPFNLFSIVILTVVVVSGIYFVLRSQKYIVIKTFIWGSILIVMTLVIQNNIVPEMELRFENTGTYVYTKIVCSQENVIQNFEKYQTISWLSTKPTGFLLPYLGMKVIVDFVNPDSFRFDNDCQTKIWRLIRWITPFISLLVLIPINQVARRFGHPENTGTAGLLFILMPNTLLMTAYIDQFLFPLLFMIGVWLTILTVKKGSLWLALLTGGWLYLSITFSYSLLPGVFFALCWLAISYLLERETHFLHVIKLGIGILVGSVMAGWLLFQIIGFNPINSFGSSLSAHRNLVMTRDSFVNKIQNVQINITEFFVWIGPVIGIVIVLGLIWFVLRSPQAFSKNKKAFLITTGLLVVALLISGQNRGEVGRLWLFLNPLMALSAAAVLEMFPQKDFKRILIMVGIIQIWSVYFYNHSLLGVLSI